MIAHRQQCPAQPPFMEVADHEHAQTQAGEFDDVEPAVGQRMVGHGQWRDMQLGDERLLLEHEAGHDRAHRERREGESETPSPDRGVAGEQADRGDQQRAE